MQVIEDELFPEMNLENREEIVIIKAFRLLAVNKIIGQSKFKADGAIGIGYITNLDKQEDSNTNFLDSVFIRSSEETMPTKIMGYYFVFGGERINFLSLSSRNRINIAFSTVFFSETWRNLLRSIRNDLI